MVSNAICADQCTLYLHVFGEAYLHPVPWGVCFVYFDGILIYEDQDEHLEQLFGKMQFIWLKKCTFMVEQVIFLGFVVPLQGV